MENRDEELLEVLKILKEEETKEQESTDIGNKKPSKFKKFMGYVKDRFNLKNMKKEFKENKLKSLITLLMIIYMIFTIILNIRVVYYYYTPERNEETVYTNESSSGGLSTHSISGGMFEYENIVITKNKIIVYIIQIACIIGMILIPKDKKKGFICIIILFVVCNITIFRVPVQYKQYINLYDGNFYKNIYGVIVKPYH